MLNNQTEKSLSQRFSLYALPLIGAMGVLLFSLSLKLLKINSVLTVGAWSIDLSALLILLFEQFVRAGAKFTVIFMFAYHFRVTVFTLKNSLAIFLTVIILEFIVLIFVQSAFSALNSSGHYLVYYFLGNIIGALINLAVYVGGLWLLFKSSGSHLDRFEGKINKSLRYWSIANFIPLFFVIIAVYYLLLDLYFSTGYSAFDVEEHAIVYIVNAAILTTLASLVISQKISVKRLETPTILHVGFYLGFVTTVLFIVLDWGFRQIDQMLPQEELLMLVLGLLSIYLILVMSIVYFTVKKRFY